MGGLVSSLYVYLAGAGIRSGQSREPSFWRKWSLDESAMAKLEGCWQPVHSKVGDMDGMDVLESQDFLLRMQQAWLPLE